MELWKHLLSTALLGTDHGQLQLPPDSSKLLGTLTSESPESRLLNAAAIAAIYRRAGYIAETTMEVGSDPAPEETLPTCSARALQWLVWMLENPQRYAGILQEWLEFISDKGQRVPHPYLPALIDEASRQKEDARFVAAVLRVMGERGRWLATYSKKWQFLLEFEDDQPLTDVLTSQGKMAEEQALSALKTGDPQYEPSVIEAVTRCQLPWSQKLMDAFMKKLKKRSRMIMLYML